MSGPRRPETPHDWVEHAIHVHREGLAVLDRLAGVQLPVDVAGVQVGFAQAYFAAARSAAAIAGTIAGLG